jgi:hypothetical protein
MKFERLLELVGDEPVFETSLFLAGEVDPHIVRLQLTRWTKSGRIYQLRRSLYAIAPPHQKVKPHPFLIANRLQRASYISQQSALAFYGLIPDTVHVTLSVSAGRRERLETPLGSFEFRHIKPQLLRGYRMVDLGRTQPVQQALVATPRPSSTWSIYNQVAIHPHTCELRLQNLDQLNLDDLHRQSELSPHPGSSAVDAIVRLAQSSSGVSSIMKDYLAELVRQAPTPTQGRNLAREYLQARILAALQRAGAMIPLAFHGGTALRFLYAHGRYSEDLDFALEGDRQHYDFRSYLQSILDELMPEGYSIELKVNDRKTIHSAYLTLSWFAV